MREGRTIYNRGEGLGFRKGCPVELRVLKIFMFRRNGIVLLVGIEYRYVGQKYTYTITTE
jgi:hypothetical protein